MNEYSFLAVIKRPELVEVDLLPLINLWNFSHARVFFHGLEPQMYLSGSKQRPPEKLAGHPGPVGCLGGMAWPSLAPWGRGRWLLPQARQGGRLGAGWVQCCGVYVPTMDVPWRPHWFYNDVSALTPKPICRYLSTHLRRLSLLCSMFSIYSLPNFVLRWYLAL